MSRYLRRSVMELCGWLGRRMVERSPGLTSVSTTLHRPAHPLQRSDPPIGPVAVSPRDSRTLWVHPREHAPFFGRLERLTEASDVPEDPDSLTGRWEFRVTSSSWAALIVENPRKASAGATVKHQSEPMASISRNRVKDQVTPEG